MPAKRKNNGKRYKSRKMVVASIPRKNLATGIPESLLVKMKWSDTIALTGGLNAATYGSYVLNGMAIPDSGKATVQPYQYDELAALYEGYICYASKIRIQFLSTSVDRSLLCTLRPQNDTSSTTSNARLGERPYTKTAIATYSAKPIVLTSYRAMSNQMGVSKTKIDADDEFQGSMTSTSNPAQKAYWVFSIQDMDQATASDACVSTQITYYCRLFKRKRVGVS